MRVAHLGIDLSFREKNVETIMIQTHDTILTMNGKFIKVVCGFLAVVTCAYVVRDSVYRMEKRRIAAEYRAAFGRDIGFIPFTIESAIMYSYALDVAEGRGIPKYDKSLVGMDDIDVWRQFSIGLEPFLGYGYRLKKLLLGSGGETTVSDYEDDPEFTAFAKTQLRLWISLISGFVFLWLVALRIPLPAALVGGLLHAVSCAAVARYTAQDIVRGNFAMPLIVAAFAVAAWYMRSPSKVKLALTGFAVFAGLATWDLTRMCFGLWGVAEIVRIMSGGIVSIKRRRLWHAICFATLAAAFLVPYHREHSLITSPFAMVLLPLVLTLQHLGADRRLGERFAILAGAIAVFAGLWSLAPFLGAPTGNYTHFTELMKAKIRFLNIKPADPRLLNFEARSVWVPGMHSATRYIVNNLFPMSLHLAFLGGALALCVGTARKELRKLLPIANLPFLLAVFYSISFVFIVRHHVLAILFISMSIPILLLLWWRCAGRLDAWAAMFVIGATTLYFSGWNIYLAGAATSSILFSSLLFPLLGVVFALICASVAGIAYKLKTGKRPSTALRGKVVISALVLLMFMFEIDGLSRPRLYESHFFPETAALVRWLRAEPPDAPVLADFQLSPILKAYCHSKIILQPKFELRKTRRIYEEFIDALFKGNERSLAEFCAKYHAGYFVFDKGVLSARGPFSPIYMAGLTEIKEDSPVCMMAFPQNRKKLEFFREIAPPRELRILSNRYVVFKIARPPSGGK